MRSHQRIALDTNVLIYHFEASPRYGGLTDVVFRWLEAAGRRAITSSVTMTEVLVKPSQARDGSADDLFGLLSTYPNLEWIPPDLNIAALAAEYRALYRIGTMDALQAATAVRAKATCLITNDADFRKVDGLKVLLLEDYV